MNYSPEERALLVRGLARLLRSRAKNDSGNIEVRSDVVTFTASPDALNSTITALENETALDRRSLRIVLSYLDLTALTLAVKVIPNYGSRSDVDASYKADAVSKLAKVTSAKQKTERALNAIARRR